MAKLHQFTRSLEPITDFDGEDEEEGISTGDGLHQIVAVRANEGTQNSMRNHSILAFLDQLCQHQEPDPEKQNRLYNYMCEALIRLNIIPAVSQLQFLAPVRKQFHDALMKLFSAAHRLVKEGNPMDGMVSAEQPQAIARFFTPSMKVDSLFNSVTSDFLTSKFQTEFILISILGEGGYGSVFKAKKKADDIIYAVKKIKLNHDKKNAVKAFREVKQLAKLSHPNVIRYFDSWCEYEMESSILLVDETDNHSQHSNARSGASFITFERNEDSFSEGQTTPVPSSFNSRSTSQQVHRVNLSSSSRRSSSISQPAAHLGNGVNSALSVSHVSTAQFCNRNTELENVVLYIQTELCDMTLQDWLKSRNSSKDMDVTLNRQILKQILKGVEYIHSCGLVHRDIKPLNILLIRRDHGKCKFLVKICDFGLVRDISTGSETTVDVYRRLFQGATRPFIDLDSGRLSAGIGTELYASPEQLAGSGYTNKTDMYSVGLLMYEIFCPMSTDMERMKRLNKIPKGILDEDFQRDWPTEAKFVRDLTQKDPGARPSATAVLNEYIKSNNADFLKIELSNTQSELKKVNTLLSETTGHLEEAQLEILEKDEELREKEEELREKEEELREKEEELKEKEELREKDEVLREKDEELREKDEELREKDEELREKDEELREKDEELKEKDEELREKDEELREKDEELREKDEELKELMRQLKELKTILNKK